MSDPSYSEKLKDPRWQKKRLEIFERDRWMCRSCLDSENTLSVHHLFYLPKTDPWDYPDGFLLTLCEDCHNNQEIKKEIVECIGVFLGTYLDKGQDLTSLRDLGLSFSYLDRPSPPEFISLTHEITRLFVGKN
jgi:hypothetical protein